MTQPQQPKSNLVLVIAEPTEMLLDGRKLRVMALSLPNGERRLFTEGSDAAELLAWLLAASHDPAMPRAEMSPKKSFAEVVSETIHLLNGTPKG